MREDGKVSVAIGVGGGGGGNDTPADEVSPALGDIFTFYSTSRFPGRDVPRRAEFCFSF